MARVLVVDGEPELRNLLLDYLRHDTLEVVLASESRALNEALAATFDVIILDVLAREPSACVFLHQIRSRNVHTPVLLIAAAQCEREIAAGLNCGADGYLVVPFSPAVLQAKVRSVARRGLSAATHVFWFGSLAINSATREVSRDGRSVQLSRREFDLLCALASHPNEPITKEGLLEVAWRDRRAASLNVVEVYIGYLRRRLEKIGADSFVVTKRGQGYELRAVITDSEDASEDDRRASGGLSRLRGQYTNLREYSVIPKYPPSTSTEPRSGRVPPASTQQRS